MNHASPLKTAFFSALLVLAVAYPVLGLKLTTVGIKLEVQGASPAMLWTICGAAVLMFQRGDKLLGFTKHVADTICSEWL